MNLCVYLHHYRRALHVAGTDWKHWSWGLVCKWDSTLDTRSWM